MSDITLLSSSVISPLYILATCVVLLCTYAVAVGIYRAYLGPLSKFPGPRLAAATLWYEFYYDVIKQGQYTWQIAELHKQYGPIVRINPYELHINDPDYYDVLYTGPTKPREKWSWPTTMFAPLNPFFSKQAVTKVEPMIRYNVEKLSSRVRGFQQSKQPLNLRHAFGALAMDIVTEYCFSQSYNSLDEPEFASLWFKAMNNTAILTPVNKQFPWFMKVLQQIPIWVLDRFDKPTANFIHFQDELRKRIVKIKQDSSKIDSQWGHKTIFHELLQSPNLPSTEKETPRLVDEGQTIVTAGQITTAYFMNTTSYHIVANPDIMRKVKAELAQAMPDGVLPPYQQLEQLPYLSSVVLEGYRLTYGTSHRLQRVMPHETMTYKDHVIPPGTAVGMTVMFIHEDPDLFPDPKKFDPERWTDPEERRRLEKYVHNFSKGTQGCIGPNLAKVEIFLAFAALFSRYDLNLCETTREDIDIAHDFYNPAPRKGSVGLRVLVS